MGQENAGTQQAKQGRCFKHGGYSQTQVAEIQAEMGSAKGESQAEQAPKQDHAETGRSGL
jgi:hypothetical protein